MKKVITYGTFDLLHIGHIRILERAKALGDYLVVAVSTDEFNLQKGKVCTYSFAERSEIIRALRYVDEVIAERSWEQKKDDILEYKANIFVMGGDWQGKFDYLKSMCEVVYLPRTEGISTAQIKNELRGDYAC